MGASFRGRLITATFADTTLPTLDEFLEPPDWFARAMLAWSRKRVSGIGPATSVRGIADVAVIPLMRMAGFAIETRSDDGDRCHLALGCRDTTVAGLVVPWNTPLDRAWRAGVTEGLVVDATWTICSNGQSIRLIDTRRTWTRDYLEIEFDVCAEDEATQRLFWTLMSAPAFSCRPPVIETAAAGSAEQGASLCRALGDGVLSGLGTLVTALARRGRTLDERVDQALTVLYRVLFLLFAEARGLVPVWHPIYRERYTVGTIVTALLEGRRCSGIWPAVRAISHMAHAGCAAGDLVMPAFNGRLFAPTHTSALDSAGLADRVMADMVLALGSARLGGTRARIAYRDLDVEQLGSVYERVLDWPAHDIPRTRRGDARKSTGTFYTPRLLTAALVRRTLEPLVRGRRSEEILALRVLDPAMGSGAFLVAACRYLAEAVEQARVDEGIWHTADVTAADRIALRREIVLRCLYGVDRNPTAVHVARLSLWLATLASDKPLTFLDHRLVAGNSLVGATPDDVHRQPTRDGRGRHRHSATPLFQSDGLLPLLEQAVLERQRIAAEPDDSADIVRRKEQRLASLSASDSPLGPWRRLLDLWCAGWFWGDDAPARATFGELSACVIGGTTTLPPRVASVLLRRAGEIAADEGFLHWPLVFPEVFVDNQGRPLANPGFDAVIGNPPWDMVRGDSGDTRLRAERRTAARRLSDFVREAGVYRVTPVAHANRYQLFVERSLQLTRRGGRLGLVLPSGFLSDAGAAPLRRHVFDRARIECLTGVDNRHGIFPIHRSIRFVLFSACAGQPTNAIDCRFGVSRMEELQPATPAARGPLLLTRALLERVSGADDLGVPELSSSRDLAILERISAHVPALASARGWNVSFSRELNATDDSAEFVPFGSRPGHRPVLEGKQIEPFRARVRGVRWEIPASSAAARRVPRRPRLAYRDVASATNRLTLIAAIVPSHCVTTHTLFCLQGALPLPTQRVLSALLNSFVANYLVRMRVSTHVTRSLLARLPVPMVAASNPVFHRLSTLAHRLELDQRATDGLQEYAELQAIAAGLYGLTREEFEHITTTFPLVDVRARARAVEMCPRA